MIWILKISILISILISISIWFSIYCFICSHCLYVLYVLCVPYVLACRLRHGRPVGKRAVWRHGRPARQIQLPCRIWHGGPARATSSADGGPAVLLYCIQACARYLISVLYYTFSYTFFPSSTSILSCYTSILLEKIEGILNLFQNLWIRMKQEQKKTL